VTDFITLTRRAYEFAWLNSDDPSTQCGALIIDEGVAVAYGANKFPTGLDRRKLCFDRDTKLTYIEHAERAAIYEAARAGTPTLDRIMVAPWSSCEPCARAIVLSGIRKVVAHKQAYDITPDRWRESIAIGLEILRAGGVEYELLDAKIGYVQNRFDGRLWNP
jgi:dCMP deaminase